MRARIARIVVFGAVSVVGSDAVAETVVPPDRDREWSNAAPDARERGFQGAIGASAAKTYDGYFGTPFALTLEGGFKQSRSVFLGGYVSGALGPPGSTLGHECPGCTGLTTMGRFGALFRKDFLPGERFNPWLGVGLGWSFAKASLDRSGIDPVGAEASGLDIRVTLGIDIRVSRGFGLGPFIESNSGFWSGTFENGRGVKRPVSDDAGKWLALGWRIVILP